MRTRTKLALASTVIPIAFALRALVRLSAVEAEHAQSERAFERELSKSEARRKDAAAHAAGRGTGGCVEVAMAGCPAGAGDCNACMDALRGCLGAATRSEAYCASVPPYRATLPPAEEAASNAWQKAQSAKRRLTHWSCAATFKFVQLHCHPLK